MNEVSVLKEVDTILTFIVLLGIIQAWGLWRAYQKLKELRGKNAHPSRFNDAGRFVARSAWSGRCLCSNRSDTVRL